MISSAVSRSVIILFGVIFPAYASFKAVKTRDMRAYVKWMTYWIAYSFFASIEHVADMFVTWIPFYYEIKIVAILWLMSPFTNGSLRVYKKLVVPILRSQEHIIDWYIASVGGHGYKIFWRLGTFLTKFVMKLFVEGHDVVIQHIRRSLSESNANTDDNPVRVTHQQQTSPRESNLHHSNLHNEPSNSDSQSFRPHQESADDITFVSLTTRQSTAIQPLQPTSSSSSAAAAAAATTSTSSAAVTGPRTVAGSYYDRYVSGRQTESTGSSSYSSSRYTRYTSYR